MKVGESRQQASSSGFFKTYWGLSWLPDPETKNGLRDAFPHLHLM